MSDNPFVDFPAGTPLLSEGSAASALFIIESGKAVVERADAPGVVLAELGPGDFCGEMSILQEQPHTASVVAKTAVRALRIEVAAFHAVLRENAEVGVQLMRRLVLRLKASEARRVQLEAMTGNGKAAPASRPAAAPAAPPPPVQGTSVQPAAMPFSIEHAEGSIPLPGGKPELLVGRPDPATGAVPEINLGPLDSARTLSRRHARLLVKGGGSFALREEPGVGNGTWVNGSKLQPEQEVPVKPGDTLRFGAIEVRLKGP
ncbi:cyclic nucleotide-binding domain-containing protein [Pseudomarimonas salicorniae]|uniref:Cyclic nucleotide-binding domain-containing protein n=1 Tax=Pseudomarimonas salicorniae TaxID=2933270 RepID=A0ABT0GCK1_9GAMM|nr:cyclic nucleotide-binding domain-containing protein [Lysobacter sp. CAU 1642]MCK7592097.1 cyclic nucleotide-binding domain-containing protein [Lysobacter sp. CAU 1642]